MVADAEAVDTQPRARSSLAAPVLGGLDARSGVDNAYRLPFKFIGTINSVTYRLGPEQLTAEDRAITERMLTAAHDGPARELVTPEHPGR